MIWTTLDRRCFLKTAAAAGLFVFGPGAMMAGCSGVRRADVDSNGAEAQASPNLDAAGRQILYLASLAPSGHNSQPWVVRVKSDREWVVGADPDRRLPAVDPQNRELLLSVGAFAENLSLAAAAAGYAAHVEVIAADAFDPDILRVELKKDKPVQYPLERIRRRTTVRSGYRNAELSKRDVDALTAPCQGTAVYFPRGSEHARCLTEGSIENFRIQSLRDDAQEELVRWLRLSNADARRFRDGLTTESMEIRGIKGFFVRHFVKPQDFLKASFRRQGVDVVAEQAHMGGGWIVIVGGDRRVADLIDTGRRFQRLFLLARELKIGIHPMTQYLEEEAGQQEIAANHPASIRPQFILRVGYLDAYPEPVSLRRPVAAFVRAA